MLRDPEIVLRAFAHVMPAVGNALPFLFFGGGGVGTG